MSTKSWYEHGAHSKAKPTVWELENLGSGFKAWVQHYPEYNWAKRFIATALDDGRQMHFKDGRRLLKVVKGE